MSPSIFAALLRARSRSALRPESFPNWSKLLCHICRSTILAQAAGVPTLPWSGSDVAVSFEECGGDIPADVYDKACIHSLEDALACCQRIGYPIMLKASWGGGGKGIRKVG